MAKNKLKVTELEEFLRKPDAGFSVKAFGSVYRVHSDSEESLVLIDDFDFHGGKVVFQKSLGRNIKMQNLWEYTSMRKRLLSKRVYLLASVCQDKLSEKKKSPTVLKRFVVSFDGNDALIKWQLERGLDYAISSVVGESYRVNIDFTESLERWAAAHIRMMTDQLIEVKPVWTDASFTLKYYSDALFDFPHWFGQSKRQFKLKLT